MAHYPRVAFCAAAAGGAASGALAAASTLTLIPTLTPTTSYEHSSQEIHSQGYTTLRNILSEEERRVLLRHTRRHESLNPQELEALPACAEPTRGRFHCELTSTFHRQWSRSDHHANAQQSPIKATVLAVELKTKAFATTFFNQHRFRMTQLQLLDSEPNSAEQFWHLDNTTQGLTYVIALEDVEEIHGPTELMTTTQQTHRAEDGSLNVDSCLSLLRRAMLKTPVTAAAAPTDNSVDCAAQLTIKKAVVRQRDAFVFDSRTWHRGGANVSNRTRPVLIVRYDLSNHSPPGMGILNTALLRFVGWLIEDAVASK